MKVLSPTNSRSGPVVASTPDPDGPKRWKSCSFERSWTSSWYVPGSRWVTGAPSAPFRLIAKPGPTVPMSCGVSAEEACRKKQQRRRGGKGDDEAHRPDSTTIRPDRFHARSEAPKRSRERGDDPLPQRGPVLVRQRPLGRLELDAERDRLAPRPGLLAAVDVEDANLAQLRPCRLARGGDEVAGRHVLVDDEREILLQRRVGDHVLVQDALGHAREQLGEVELERAPLAVEQPRVELGDPAALDRRGSGGPHERMLRALEAGLELERLEKRLDRALRA